MIIEFLLDMLKSVILFGISLLPELPFFGFLTGIGGFVEVLLKASIFIDMGVFASCLGVWFILYNFEFVYAILEWVWKKIPGVD